METKKETPVKKPYHAPQLTVYGDIREITRSGATGTHGDGMTGAGMNLS